MYHGFWLSVANGVPECANGCVSASSSVSCADLGRFSFCLFVLSYSIVLIFVYFITVPEKTVF